MEDGAVRIFINTKGTNKEDFSQEFLDFMEYINSSTDEIAERTDSNKIKLIHENVKRVKASEKIGVRIMQRWEELAYEREEGRAEAMIETLQEFGFSKEEIVKHLIKKMEISEEDVKKYVEKFYIM